MHVKGPNGNLLVNAQKKWNRKFNTDFSFGNSSENLKVESAWMKSEFDAGLFPRFVKFELKKAEQ